MKAWVLHSVGDIRLEEVELPALKPDEVRVHVEAAGICGSDIPRIYTTGAHRMPLIPGHELAGEVVAVGSAADTCWQGRRVGVYPLIPCGKCGPCLAGHAELCRAYDYIGSRRDGGFAEYVDVPAGNVIELPDTVSYEEAAMLEPMAVAVHAMRRGLAQGPGQGSCGAPEGQDISDIRDKRIAVCGLGTIGMLLVMLLMERGARDIYVIGNKDIQREKVTALGIPKERYCDSRQTDVPEWLRDRTGGLDIYFECVGRAECVSYGIEAAAPMGRLVLTGNPYSDMPLERDVYWRILREQLSITGTWNSSFSQRENTEKQDDWHYVLGRLREGRISPGSLITHRLQLEELERGFHIMRDKTEHYTKVMLVRDR